MNFFSEKFDAFNLKILQYLIYPKVCQELTKQLFCKYSTMCLYWCPKMSFHCQIFHICMSVGWQLAYLLISNLSSSKNMLHSHRKTLKRCPKYYVFIQSTIHNMLSFFCLHFSAILSYIPPIYHRFIIITFQNFIFPLFTTEVFPE